MNHQETGRYFEVASVLFPEFEEPECRVPFIGSGNIWIERHYDRYERDLARFIIQRAVMNTAEGELSIVGYDPILSGIFAPFSALCSGETKIIDFIDNEIAMIDKKADKARARAEITKAEGDEMRAVVESALTEEWQSIASILEVIGDEEFTKGKVSARLGALVKQGVAEKESQVIDGKRTMHYRIIND